MRKARENQLVYLVLGIVMLGFGIYLNYDFILKQEFPEAIMTFFLGITFLMMAYLSPHIFPRDERAKDIMGKSMMVNYFVLFGVMAVLFLLLAPSGPLVLTASQALIVLFCIMVTSIPLTMIVFAKRI